MAKGKSASTFEHNLKSYLINNFNPGIASRKAEGEIWSAGSSKGALFEKGKMYVMVYMTPDEPFYDQMPVVLSMGTVDSTHMIGLNLHYITYQRRVGVIKEFNAIFNSIIEKSIEKSPEVPEKQKSINSFSYNFAIGTFIKKYGLEKCIHMYRVDRIKRIVCLPYEKWHLGVVHNENHFFGGTIADAQGVILKKPKKWDKEKKANYLKNKRK